MSKKEASRKGSSGGLFLVVLFGTTILVSGALLFLVEPMSAKFVLPTFGGTPAVWTGSMMFFQAALLAGYLYVHLTTTWLGTRRQAWLHLAVVLLPLFIFLLWGPLAVPADEWAPRSQENPIFLLLGVLLVSVGLPFFALSTTNPIVQRWLSDTDHPAARDPYFLYVASNLGSVIGLLGYPLLVERELTLANQGIWWSVGYGGLALLVIGSAIMMWRSDVAPTTVEDDEAEPPGGAPNAPVASGGGTPETGAPLTEPAAESSAPTFLRRARWVGLTFVPSSLMLGVTAFITTDITPVPLLWVIPLSLYLFSFMVVFSPSVRVPDILHKAMVVLLPITMALMVVTMLTQLRDPYWLLILLHILGFFVVAMVCHGEVARDRPPARHLTEFYLWVAVGGVLGGVFNALVAPVVFDTVVEYPLVIVLACLFLPGAILARLLRRNEERNSERSGVGRLLEPRLLDLALPVALGVVVWALGDLVIDELFFDSLTPDQRTVAWELTIGLAVVVCLYFAYFSNRQVRFGLGVAAVIVAATIATGTGNILYEDRSFFGVYKVTSEAEGAEYHVLTVGDTNHGAQILGPQPPQPIGYHDRTGPFGQLFDLLPGETTDESPVGVMGLGAGVMSCYAEPGQQWTYYEIDPLVEQVARNENLFTYLRDCPGEYEVVQGDARLRIAEAEDGEYGMIVGEAFSSDAIPVHLMTREAVDLYLQKLREDGVLVMHISNRHLELEPVVGDLARDRGLVCYAQYDDAQITNLFKLTSHFTVLARDEADLGSLPSDGRWQPCVSNPETDRVWTDDYSNLLSTFNWN
ncbi:MAG: fused MFS/spermidine synthase [Actinomycetota bacterium]|nr:fused MFS/spermidine synthase [Actinomycetota bacterium]